MAFDFLGAGCNFVVTKDKLEGDLQGNVLKYQRRFFQDKPYFKYYDLLTDEVMWHYLLRAFCQRKMALVIMNLLLVF